MAAHKLKISSPRLRSMAWAWVKAAPEGSIISIQTEPKHSDDQRNKLWAMLGDLSKQCEIRGEKKLPETWKMVMMHKLKYEITFEIGLNGDPFPTGYSIKELSVPQMGDMIESMYQYGAENDVKWSERGYDAPERG